MYFAQNLKYLTVHLWILLTTTKGAWAEKGVFNSQEIHEG